MNKEEDFEIEIEGIDNIDESNATQRTMSVAASSSRDSELRTQPSSASPLNDENDVILTDHEDAETGSTAGSNIGLFKKGTFEENRMKYMPFRYGWCKRTLFTDWTVQWLNGFVAFM